MSILRAGNREWALYIFVGAVLIALCLAVVYLEPVKPSSAVGIATASTAGDAAIKQAPWRIGIHPAGVTRRLDERARARLKAQGKQLRALVRETYDALFLQPSNLPEIVRVRFVGSAGSAFLRSEAGLPKDSTNVRALTRRARLGIQAPNARHAAGQVWVVVKTTVNGKPIRLRHRSTLWLRRGSSTWKVVAFEIDQERVR
ncbi:MAG: hypothetical protein ABR505_07745 [Actinomycetota bacterium]